MTSCSGTILLLPLIGLPHLRLGRMHIDVDTMWLDLQAVRVTTPQSVKCLRDRLNDRLGLPEVHEGVRALGQEGGI
jgi:hypothetical protein